MRYLSKKTPLIVQVDLTTQNTNDTHTEYMYIGIS